jgi:hypothetical protein
MTRAALVAAALVLLARPLPVLAGSSCGGGGSSGGGSSSGGSSSGDSSSGSDSGSSSSSTPACRDTTDVVGYRECTAFGTWATAMKLPHMIIELGTSFRATPSLASNRAGNVTHGAESFAYRTVAPTEPGLDHEIVTTIRMGTSFARRFYALAEVEAGALVAAAGPRTEMMSSGTFGTPAIEQQGGVAINVAGVIGMSNAIGRGRIGVELAGGLRTVNYSFASSYHGCETTSSFSASAPLLEARVHGETWLTPWISAGATVGTSMIDQGSWMGALTLGFHTRAFAGSR